MKGASLVVVAAALAGGCRANPNYCEGSPDNRCPTGVDGTPIADAPATDGPDGSGSGSANTYRPTAVQFALSYLTTPAFSDVQNSPKGVYSVWIKFDGSDGTAQDITIEQFFMQGGVSRTTQNKVRFWLRDCNGSTTVDMETANPIVSGSGWVHILAAWDASLGKAKIYVNDNLDVANVQINTNGNVCYYPPSAPREWGIGGVSGNALVADVADMYGALGTYQDVDDMLVRRKFIDVHGKPVDLGAQCQIPAGAPPTLCLHGDFATWKTNRGVGGGFDLNGGALAPSSTNPAD